jgi:hypothetical protein
MALNTSSHAECWLSGRKPSTIDRRLFRRKTERGENIYCVLFIPKFNQSFLFGDDIFLRQLINKGKYLRSRTKEVYEIDCNKLVFYKSFR